MWEMATNFTEVLGAVLMIVWTIAGWRLTRLWIVLGQVVLLLQIVLVAITWQNGWDFVSNRVVLALPLVTVPAAFTLFSRLERRVPVQVTAVGAALDFWVVFVDRPAPPYVIEVFELWAVLLAATALLWFQRRRRWLSVIGAVVAALALIIGYGVRATVLPDRVDMMAMPNVDWGGGPAGMFMPGMKSVADLKGPSGQPDVTFTLTAGERRLRLSSGRMVAAWAFNGQVPGPGLRVHQGDLVQVTLVNRLPREGVTLHWHGVDVPNAEDGVAGVTQDAVQPGQSHVYRFRAEQAGSYWYHSHQDSEEAVDRGLFGPLVILPKGPAAALDLPVMAHNWGDTRAFGTSDTLERRAVAPGTPVRLRLINTGDNTASDSDPRTFALTGTAFKVAAVDGRDLTDTPDLRDVRLPMAIGGRYDVTFTMPANPVRLVDLGNPAGGLLLSRDGSGAAPAVPSKDFDPARYGQAAPNPFTRFDRDFKLILDDGPAFYDGQFYFPTAINNRLFPDTPMLMVRQGDAVRTTFVNRGHQDHPMHLHGHHALVLSRNGEPVTSWWTDSLEIKPGETYEIAFRADNPGIWMDHCHNLQHAAQGMVMHLGYDGVSTPFAVGHKTVNRPE